MGALLCLASFYSTYHVPDASMLLLVPIIHSLILQCSVWLHEFTKMYVSNLPNTHLYDLLLSARYSAKHVPGVTRLTLMSILGHNSCFTGGWIHTQRG